MARWYHVATREEIAPGKPKIVEVAGKSIGVFYEGDKFYAILNYCPHFGAPVCQGYVSGAVVSDEPGVQSYDSSRPILRCPWHRWEFDMATGRALTPIKERLKTYPVTADETEVQDVGVTTFSVRLEGERVWVEL